MHGGCPTHLLTTVLGGTLAGAPRQYLSIKGGSQAGATFAAVRTGLASAMCEAAVRNRTLLLDTRTAAAVDVTGLLRWFPVALHSWLPHGQTNDVLEVDASAVAVGSTQPKEQSNQCRHIHRLLFLLSPPRPARPLEHGCFRTMSGGDYGKCAMSCALQGECQPGDATVKYCSKTQWRLSATWLRLWGKKSIN